MQYESKTLVLKTTCIILLLSFSVGCNHLNSGIHVISTKNVPHEICKRLDLSNSNSPVPYYIPLYSSMEYETELLKIDSIYSGSEYIRQVSSKALWKRYRLRRCDDASKEKALKSKLNKISDTSRFFISDINTTNKTSTANFVEALDIRNGTFSNELSEACSIVLTHPVAYKIFIPERWCETISDEQPMKLWVLASVKVDAFGRPLELPSSRAKPIAIQTTEALYEVLEEIILWESIPPAPCPIPEMALLELSGDQIQNKDLIDVSDALSKTVHKIITASPFDAEKIKLIASPSDELLFRRTNKKSEILSSFAGPYYEHITYSVRWWWDWHPSYQNVISGASRHVPYAEPIKLNIRISFYLTTAVGKHGTYERPSEQQLDQYYDELISALEKIKEEMRSELNGEFDGDVLIVRKEKWKQNEK